MLILPDQLLIVAERLVVAESLPPEVRLCQADHPQQHEDDSLSLHRFSKVTLELSATWPKLVKLTSS